MSNILDELRMAANLLGDEELEEIGPGLSLSVLLVRSISKIRRAETELAALSQQLAEARKVPEWAETIRGVRVDGENVVLSVKGGNDAARRLCEKLVGMLNAAPTAPAEGE